MPYVEPTGVHQTRQSSNGRNEVQNNNGESSKPSTSTNENPEILANNSPGQAQQVVNNQSSNANAAFIQNRQGR